MRPVKVAMGFVLGLLITYLASAQPPGPFGGPGGGFTPPQPGQILSGSTQQRLKLTAEQKKKLDELQKEVDAQLEKVLTAEQKKTLKQPPGFPGFGRGNGPPGMGGPGAGGGFGQPGGGRLADVKKLCDASDEEWKVIGPKVETVIAARQVLASTSQESFPAFGGPGGPGRAFAGPGAGFGPRGGQPKDGERPMPPRGDGPPAPPAPRDGDRPMPPPAPRDGERPMPPRGDAAPPAPPPAPGRAGGGLMGPNVVSQAQADLKALLKTPKHSAAEVQEKVAAVRKAREKARHDLEVAQKELLLLLTAEQQAVMVSMGYLD